MVSLVPILSWIAAIAAAVIAIEHRPAPRSAGFVVDRLLRYIFVFPVGFMSLWAAVGHIAFPAMAARSIGWSPSPFQFEVGVANLGLGIAGLYAAFRGFEARLALSLALACFLIGAGIGHIRDILTAGNLSPGSAGPILFTDMLTPLVILVLLFVSRPHPKR